MIEMFTGKSWAAIEGPLSLGTLRAKRRAIVKFDATHPEIYTPVRISEDLVLDAKAMQNFVPKGFYMFSEVASEKELGRVEVFVLSTT